MDGWDGGIQEEPARPPASSGSLSSSVGKSSTGLLRKSPSTKKKRKSVRFNNAVTVKVVPRVHQLAPPKTSFITGTLLDPTTRTFRYLLLFLLCIQTYGANFIRFSPNILEGQLKETFGITSDNFFLVLFAAADIPAYFLVLVVGYLVDKYFVVGKSAIGFAVGVIIGQLVFALGAFTKSLAVLMAGRVLFQVTSGGLYVTQAASAARWLAGVEMGLAIGIALCLAELTMIFASWMLPLAANDYGVGQSLVLGALMAVASLSATVLASALDAWGNDQLPKAPRDSMYIPQTVVTTKTMTATMTSTSTPSSSSIAQSVPPPPMPSLSMHIEYLPPQSPPAQSAQSPPQSSPHSPPQSAPLSVPQSPPQTPPQTPPQSSSLSPSHSSSSHPHSQSPSHPLRAPPTPSLPSQSPSSPQILSQSPAPTYLLTPTLINNIDTQSYPANNGEPPEPEPELTELSESSELSNPLLLSEPPKPPKQSELLEPAELSEPAKPSELSEPLEPSELSEPPKPSELSEPIVPTPIISSIDTSDDEESEPRAFNIHDSLMLPRQSPNIERDRRTTPDPEANLGAANTFTASMQISTRSAGNAPSSPRSVSMTYGSRSIGASFETTDTTPRQINEEGSHYRLLILLVVASIFVLPSGVISQSLDDFENILYVAAATAPAVGWVIDRAGRPCLFMGLGASVQFALQLAAIIARATGSYSRALDDVVQIASGVTWSVTVCGAYAGVALLVSNGWAGCAFAVLTVVNGAAISLAPLFYTYAHEALYVLIAAAVATAVGLVVLWFLFRKRSILNMSARAVRRVVGYTVDSDERVPLLANSL